MRTHKSKAQRIALERASLDAAYVPGMQHNRSDSLRKLHAGRFELWHALKARTCVRFTIHTTPLTETNKIPPCARPPKLEHFSRRLGVVGRLGLKDLLVHVPLSKLNYCRSCTLLVFDAAGYVTVLIRSIQTFGGS